MHFSSKIKKFYQGMQVYEELLEDEKAIHIPFALSFTVTIATINGQLKTYLTDLENKVCREIPDIDFDLMTNIYNIMSLKLKGDMMAFGNKTIRQILEELFGDMLDKTPAEIYEFIFNNTKLMTEYLKKIRVLLGSASPALFEDYVLRHIREHRWDDIEWGYLKWKKEYTELTLDHLLEKQEQTLQEYLERGIMRFARIPSNDKVRKVDFDSHAGLLKCSFKVTDDYRIVYTQFMQYAMRKNGMLTINLKKYGKYIFDHYYDFAEGQKVALFELIVMLNLIHKDMVALKPELEKHQKSSKTQDDEVTGDDERIAKSIKVMNEEGTLKHLYDYTWVMEVMNQTKDLPHFDTPASFITYMEDLGIRRLPSESTINKKQGKFNGKFPNWVFTDCDKTEAMRRINVGKRFLSLYRKS
jgi:hypothetical protein